MIVITSPQNERVKLVRALQSQARVRRKAGRIVLEGVRLIADAVDAGSQPDFVLYTAEAVLPGRPGEPLLALLRARGAACLEVTPSVMAHMADTPSSQGIIAVVPMPGLPLPASPDLVLVADAVADPGNLGTLLRAAAAAGVEAVILAPGCVDSFNPKVLRGGMGAHFRVPVVQMSWQRIEKTLSGLPFYLADADGEIPYYAVDWTQPAALIIGGEARGAGAQARQLARSVIAIPMANAAESLNAAVAAAIILFEMRRQRTVSKPR